MNIHHGTEFPINLHKCDLRGSGHQYPRLGRPAAFSSPPTYYSSKLYIYSTDLDACAHLGQKGHYQ